MIKSDTRKSEGKWSWGAAEEASVWSRNSETQERIVTRATIIDDIEMTIRRPWARQHFENLWSTEQLPTDQDRLLISLLSKERLAEFVRFFILFDKKIGKVAARYQQAFGIKALIEQVNRRRPDGGRQGGGIRRARVSRSRWSCYARCCYCIRA